MTESFQTLREDWWKKKLCSPAIVRARAAPNTVDRTVKRPNREARVQLNSHDGLCAGERIWQHVDGGKSVGDWQQSRSPTACGRDHGRSSSRMTRRKTDHRSPKRQRLNHDEPIHDCRSSILIGKHDCRALSSQTKRRSVRINGCTFEQLEGPSQGS
jgi:hypothetical protein